MNVCVCVCVLYQDIDQYFSVISRRFRHLVFNSSSTQPLVVSFPDFQEQCASSFKNIQNKPLCVERVSLNHDFTEWLLPYKDKGAANIRSAGILCFASRPMRRRLSMMDQTPIRSSTGIGCRVDACL